jgi:hypothetical protein
METLYSLSGGNDNEVWQSLAADLAKDDFSFNAVLQKDGITTVLTIDVDPGSGFSGGYAFTSFATKITNSTGFKFALHHEDFLDEVGKLFGMQDVVIGYPEFDKKVVVKTNDEKQVKAFFADDRLRMPWQSLRSFNLHTSGHTDEEAGIQLKLDIEDAVTNVEELRSLYNAFYSVAVALDGGGRDLNPN